MAGYVYTMIIQTVITGFLLYWNLHHLLNWL
jgi:hypothetical protein